MKVSLRQIPYESNHRDEWCLKFLFDSPDQFSSVKEWVDQTLVNSWCGWRTDKMDITVFITDHKEYTIAALKWLQSQQH